MDRGFFCAKNEIKKGFRPYREYADKSRKAVRPARRTGPVVKPRPAAKRIGEKNKIFFAKQPNISRGTNALPGTSTFFRGEIWKHKNRITQAPFLTT